mmetsp:Transcript_8064/g.15781  ORF Transcript_8064/g.15781 Transcript_8064/m.15781 type:complete len:478 (-) Transcript_8064:1421-2854(-)
MFVDVFCLFACLLASLLACGVLVRSHEHSLCGGYVAELAILGHSHAQGTSQGLEGGLCAVVVVLAGQTLHVEGHAGVGGEALQRMLQHLGGHRSDHWAFESQGHVGRWAAGDINDRPGKRLIQGHQSRTESRDPLLIPQGVLEGGSNSKGHIFRGVVVVDVQIAFALDVEINPRVLRQCSEHVVVESNAGLNVRLSRTVEIHGDRDRRLLGLARHVCASRRGRRRRCARSIFAQIQHVTDLLQRLHDTIGTGTEQVTSNLEWALRRRHEAQTHHIARRVHRCTNVIHGIADHVDRAKVRLRLQPQLLQSQEDGFWTGLSLAVLHAHPLVLGEDSIKTVHFEEIVCLLCGPSGDDGEGVVRCDGFEELLRGNQGFVVAETGFSRSAQVDLLEFFLHLFVRDVLSTLGVFDQSVGQHPVVVGVAFGFCGIDVFMGHHCTEGLGGIDDGVTIGRGHISEYPIHVEQDGPWCRVLAQGSLA